MQATSTNVGDEGGFAPNLEVGRGSADLHHEGDRRRWLQAGRRRGAGAGLRGDRVLQEASKYAMEGEGKSLDSAGMAKYLAGLVGRFPIVSIEDGMAEDDWQGWKALTDAIGAKCQLVGDDLFVTNTEALEAGYRQGYRQFDPGEGEPDRLALGNARCHRDGAGCGLHGRHLAPLRRDGGCHDCRHRGGDQRRADQDWLARRAPTGRRSTTSSSASRKTSATSHAMPGRVCCARKSARHPCHPGLGHRSESRDPGQHGRAPFSWVPDISLGPRNSGMTRRQRFTRA